MYVDPAYVTKQVSLVDKPAPRDFEQAALKKGPNNWKLANKKITAFQGVLKKKRKQCFKQTLLSRNFGAFSLLVQLWQHTLLF